MVARDLELVRADRRALPRRAHQQRRLGAAGARGQAARAAGDLRGDAAPPDADRRGLRRLRHVDQVQPAAAHRRPTSTALREALADGTIDAIATDHAPHSPVEKDVEFEQAAFGMIGLETALPLVLELVARRDADAGRAGRRAERRAGARLRAAGRHAGRRRAAPTSRSSIPRRPGRVDRGRAAVDARATRRFRGETLRGRAALTVVGGTIAYSRRTTDVSDDAIRAASGAARHGGRHRLPRLRLRRGRRRRAARSSSTRRSPATRRC